jgi:hypothetical protein
MAAEEMPDTIASANMLIVPGDANGEAPSASTNMPATTQWQM